MLELVLLSPLDDFQMSSSVHKEVDWFSHLPLVLSRLDEKQRRWVAGLLSEVLGYGGISRVAELSGLDRKTIQQGRKDLDTHLDNCPKDRIRRAGAGRPTLKKTHRN